MPSLTSKQWADVLRRAREGQSISSLARSAGVSRSTIARRLAAAASTDSAADASRENRPKLPGKSARAHRFARASSKAPTIASRRKLLNRLYQAIDTKLKLMERRMHSEISALEAEPGAGPGPAGLSSADHERETRALGALVKTINSVKDMQAELDRIANATADTAAAARLNADAERYRDEIAQRLARFVPGKS